MISIYSAEECIHILGRNFPTPGPSRNGEGSKRKWGVFATRGGKNSPNLLVFSPFPLGKGAGGIGRSNCATLSKSGRGERGNRGVFRHQDAEKLPEPLIFSPSNGKGQGDGEISPPNMNAPSRGGFGCSALLRNAEQPKPPRPGQLLSVSYSVQSIDKSLITCYAAPVKIRSRRHYGPRMDLQHSNRMPGEVLSLPLQG